MLRNQFFTYTVTFLCVTFFFIPQQVSADDPSGVAASVHCQDHAGFANVAECLQDPVHNPPPETTRINTVEVFDPDSILRRNSGDSNTQLIAHCDFNKPGSWFAGCWTGPVVFVGGAALYIAGMVFDAFMDFTLNPDYLNAHYINTSWTLIRDLANMTFILGIITVALMMITGTGSSFVGMDWKKLATRLIIVALLLNFSLFFSKVIIDAGNITGKFFYEAINKGNSNTAVLNVGTVLSPQGGVGTATPPPPSPAAKIVQAVDPIRMIGVPTINKITDDGKNFAFLFGFNFIYAIITLGVAFSLFTTGFMFLSRTISLIILMIVSPLAFVMVFIPPLEQYFWKWLDAIFKRSFCICVYLFLIYLLLLIISGTSAPSSTDFWEIIIFTVINVFIVIGLLRVANKQARDWCEGSSGINIGSTLSKVAVGTAAVAGAVPRSIGRFGVRASLGRTAYNWANESAGRAAESTTFAGRMWHMGKLYAGETLQNSNILGDYQGTMTKAADQRKNIHDKTKSQSADLETARIMADKESSRAKGLLGADDKLTNAGKKQVDDVSTKAADDFIKRIAPSLLAGDEGVSAASIFDTVMAGGTSAGKAAQKLVQKADKADRDSVEKANKIRRQQTRIDRDRNQKDRNLEFAGSGAVDELKEIENIMTDDDRGLMWDEHAFERLENIFSDVQNNPALANFAQNFKDSFKVINGYEDDGTPKMELKEGTAAYADYQEAWGQFKEQYFAAAQKYHAEEVSLSGELEHSQTTNQNAVQSERAAQELLNKFNNAKQTKDKLLRSEDLLKSEVALAKQIGLTVTDRGIEYNELEAGKLRTHVVEQKDNLQSSRQAVQKAENAIKQLSERKDREIKAVVDVAKQQGKQNHKAVADNSRATLNARIESIRDEAVDAISTIEQGGKLAEEQDPRQFEMTDVLDPNNR